MEARPKGVFFFAGPTGVGKTELCRALSELIFDNETALIRFDMSTFAQEHAAERLTGAPPGYVGHERGGELTNRVSAQPFSVLLFDEIEKAHPATFDKFLQILEDGRLTDGLGQTTYFSQTLIIFTSNLGATGIYERIRDRGPGQELPSPAEVAEHFEEAVRHHFTTQLNRPELLGRIGNGVLAFDIVGPLTSTVWRRNSWISSSPPARGRASRLNWSANQSWTSCGERWPGQSRWRSATGKSATCSTGWSVTR